MNLQPVIKIIQPKKLAGRRLSMCIAQDQTPLLWRSFMMQRREIKSAVGPELYCLQIYDPSLDFKNFDPQTVFDKWAAAEVTDFESIPEGMESFELEGGLYAVFTYKGRAADFEETFHYIFSTWLPGSGYELDKRPHFEVLGEKYKNNEPGSEEEVCIPIRKKQTQRSL